MEVEKLYEMLKKAQEAKGYFFNKDKERVFELLQALILNKERDRKHDKDIICPCIYRIPDVEEFGSCYCNLYVSQEWNAAKIPHQYIPERRPLEKIAF
ncbi:MAG: ferredoxin:thioredoxin reductase [Deltaproteobacteria bacterium]|nr:ferredoxin:thioredoxin reductase [Deltaproteobacteria bacterium]